MSKHISRRRFLQGSTALLLAGGLSLKLHAQNSNGNPSDNPTNNPSDTLIVYLSRTGNNKTLAEFIAKETGSSLAAVETIPPYPQNYQQMRDQAAKELSDGIFPLIKPINTEPYQRIIIVFPTWAMQLPTPMKTFLRSHNLQGKTLLPLNTHAGYGVGSGFDEIKRLANRADVKNGLSLQGGNARDGKPFVMQGETLRQTQRQIRQWLAL